MIKEMYPKEMWPEIYILYPEDFPEPTVEQLRDVEAKKIRQRYAQMMDDVAKPYTKTEQLTWDAQVLEANQYLADNTAAVPMLTVLANNRKVSIADLVTWIKENETLYKQAIGALLGQQQAELDALYNQGE